VGIELIGRFCCLDVGGALLSGMGDFTKHCADSENRPARHQAPATTAFARSRLPRSLLTAHSVVAGAWFDLVICIGTLQDLTLRELQTGYGSFAKRGMWG
jgi:hypothetical protein